MFLYLQEKKNFLTIKAQIQICLIKLRKELLILLLVSPPLAKLCEKLIVNLFYPIIIFSLPKTLATLFPLKNLHARCNLAISLINKNRSSAKNMSKTATVPMKRSVNSLTGCMSSKKTNRPTQSIKQRHVVVFCRKDTVLTEIGVTSSIHHRLRLILDLIQTILSLWWSRNQSNNSQNLWPCWPNEEKHDIYSWLFNSIKKGWMSGWSLVSRYRAKNLKGKFKNM